jgi:translocation and assembly module TamB
MGSRKGSPASAGTGTPGLSVSLALRKLEKDVLTGILEYPLDVKLTPFEFVQPEKGEMLLEVTSKELALTDLDPLLPPDIDLEGIMKIEFKAAGDLDNPAFDGRLETKGMSIAVASDLQASPTVDIAFGGDLLRPSVKGSIVIERALLRLPEMKESLHDVHGDALLWAAVDSFHAATDTTEAGKGGPASLETDEPEGFRGLDIDVTVSIPNSFRIESERMNLELEGDLRIRQEGDRPTITGELKPTKGRLSFMGRYFEIQRGSVFFYGDDEMNPSFDLSLKARVTDIDIFINLTGTALEPEIELTSNPVRSESDIMSLLLFGQTMSDLDGSQSNLLQQRTTEVLLVYGAAKLEGEMSKRLGVDMFTFEQSTRDPNETALTVGKYLNTRTMLKYEQGLENTANFLINLEYQLTSRFKIETFIDQSQETGLEINWSKEY